MNKKEAEEYYEQLKKNDKSKKAYSKKIDEIKKDMQQIF